MLIGLDGAIRILDMVSGYNPALIGAVRHSHSSHSPLRTGSTNLITLSQNYLTAGKLGRPTSSDVFISVGIIWTGPQPRRRDLNNNNSQSQALDTRSLYSAQHSNILIRFDLVVSILLISSDLVLVETNKPKRYQKQPIKAANISSNSISSSHKSGIMRKLNELA